ncbi:MAG: 30S ribosomal protein S17 [Enterobacteriaceae bacterium]
MSAKKILLGKVINKKMNKSVLVNVVKLVKHKLYRKYIKKITKLHVHDEFNKSKIGDKVKIIECRPLSKTKNWKIFKVING